MKRLQLPKPEELWQQAGEWGATFKLARPDERFVSLLEKSVPVCATFDHDGGRWNGRGNVVGYTDHGGTVMVTVRGKRLRSNAVR